MTHSGWCCFPTVLSVRLARQPRPSAFRICYFFLFFLHHGVVVRSVSTNQTLQHHLSFIPSLAFADNVEPFTFPLSMMRLSAGLLGMARVGFFDCLGGDGVNRLYCSEIGLPASPFSPQVQFYRLIDRTMCVEARIPSISLIVFHFSFH